jgi:hypothetical protein
MRVSSPRLQYLHDFLHRLHLRRERRIQQVVIHLVQARRQVLLEPAARERGLRGFLQYELLLQTTSEGPVASALTDSST